LKDFTYDLEAIAQRITHNTKLIFISNPNNPTGTIVHDEAFKRFMKAVPEDVIVVVDEAYREYVTSNEFPDALDYLRQGRNIIILRTFSKVYGLAGLRIGYGFTRTALTNYLERVRVPFNTSYLAQIGALAALDDDEHIKNSQHNNTRGLTFVYRELKILGLSYIATQTNFLLIRLGDRAEDIYRSLLQEGVIVRSMTSYGLKEYVRLTIGLPEENERFVRCLKKLLHQAAPNKDATHPS
jgi:histidinol-phosphate aminotransferase